jgi:hypothetical protein
MMKWLTLFFRSFFRRSFFRRPEVEVVSSPTPTPQQSLFEWMAQSLASIAASLTDIAVSQQSIAASEAQIANAFPPLIMGIFGQPGTPVLKEHAQMAAKHRPLLKVIRGAAPRNVHKLAAPPPGAAAAAAPGPIPDFNIYISQTNTITVMGTTAAGAEADISAVATLTPPPSSSDTSICTVSPPNPSPDNMTFGFTPQAVGSCTISFTATWNDGLIGPFSVDQPLTINSDPVTGLTPVPGTPVLKP